MLAGADGFEPLQQGHLDSLCGLYAAINGIKIIRATERPLTRCEVKRLLKRGVAELDGKRAFSKSFRKGMGHRRQLKLTKRLAAYASSIDAQIVAQKMFKENDRPDQAILIDRIEVELRKGRVVVARLRNVHNHFTVIVGMSSTRFYLADSDGLQWLPKRHVGPGDAKRPFRHSLEATELYSLSYQLLG
jgi:hypothetical protein